MDTFTSALPALADAFSLILQPQQIMFLVLGVLLGLSVGVFPGLGGIAGLSLLLPFVLIWMGYEHVHELWDLAWPWLNLGNALATAPKLIQWYEFTGVRGGTLWIILTNFAALRVYHTCRQKGVGGV